MIEFPAWIAVGSDVVHYNPAAEPPFARTGRIVKVTRDRVHCADGMTYLKKTMSDIGSLMQPMWEQAPGRRFQLLPADHPVAVAALEAKKAAT